MTYYIDNVIVIVSMMSTVITEFYSDNTGAWGAGTASERWVATAFSQAVPGAQGPIHINCRPGVGHAYESID